MENFKYKVMGRTEMPPCTKLVSLGIQGAWKLEPIILGKPHENKEKNQNNSTKQGEPKQSGRSLRISNVISSQKMTPGFIALKI